MAGSSPFSLKKTEQFEISFEKLLKSFKPKSRQIRITQELGDIIEKLIDNPYPPQSRQEPLPAKLKLPPELGFYKLVIVLAQGASGQVRLMYLVNEDAQEIKLLWIYNHEQFKKRPPDKDLEKKLKEILEE